jgi:hypothetical protein
MAKKQKPGPKADRLAIDGAWRDAVKKALSVPRPPEGWPDPPKHPQGRKPKAQKPAKTAKQGKSKV